MIYIYISGLFGRRSLKCNRHHNTQLTLNGTIIWQIMTLIEKTLMWSTKKFRKQSIEIIYSVKLKSNIFVEIYCFVKVTNISNNLFIKDENPHQRLTSITKVTVWFVQNNFLQNDFCDEHFHVTWYLVPFVYDAFNGLLHQLGEVLNPRWRCYLMGSGFTTQRVVAIWEIHLSIMTLSFRSHEI